MVLRRLRIAARTRWRGSRNPKAGVEPRRLMPLLLLSFGFGQGSAPGLEVGDKLVELLAGHPGQSGVGEQVGGLGRDRRRGCGSAVGFGRRWLPRVVGGDRVVPLAMEVVAF